MATSTIKIAEIEELSRPTMLAGGNFASTFHIIKCGRIIICYLNFWLPAGAYADNTKILSGVPHYNNINVSIPFVMNVANRSHRFICANDGSLRPDGDITLSEATYFSGTLVLAV